MAGASSATFSIATLNDSLAEGAESFTVGVVSASGGNFENLVVNPSAAVTSVTDTLNTTTVSLAASLSVAEGGSILYTAALTAPAQTALNVTLSNGAVITKRGPSGKGQLAIENGTDEDALVTLSRDGRAVYAVYCRASDDTELTGIADGDYAMFVAQGDGWNRELRRFTASPDYTKFDDPASFATVRETDAIRYTRLRITLQPVVGGNAGTVPVDPQSYPV